VIFALAIAHSVTACRDRTASVDVRDASTSVDAAAPTAPDADTRPSSAPATSPSPAASAPLLPPTLARFFAGYRDGTDFEFLRAACRPTVDRFVTLQNVRVDAIIRDARAFFRDKHDLAYAPDVRSLRVEPGDGGTTVHVPVRMRWTSPAPPDLAPQVVAWGTNAPVVLRDVTAEVEIALDGEGRITSYKELRVATPWLRVTGAENCDSEGRGDGRPEPWLDLAKGTRVQDLGETVIIGTNTKGADVARKVRHLGKTGWALDRVAFAVENPMGGSSAGGADCLAPAGPQGR
jgi:hypothetical protein